MVSGDAAPVQRAVGAIPSDGVHAGAAAVELRHAARAGARPGGQQRPYCRLYGPGEREDQVAA